MSFLADYLEYAAGDEVPKMFHVWAGYTCLSSAIFRKVWLPHGDSAIFPNIYVVLVGDAGNGKTWAMDKARRVLADVSDIFISGSVETPQGLIRFMGGNDKADPPLPANCRFPARWADGVVRDTHCITIMANEFINFISLMPQEWINVLNDVYDRDHYHYRTKNGGEDSLLGPYVTMLAALTTEVSNDLQKTRIISTGLARRTLFQYGERRWFNACPTPTWTPAQAAAKQRAINRLRELRKVMGAFSLGPGAQEWWDNWYIPHLASVPKKSPQVKSWFASKSVQVQKLAMLTALSESDELVIQIPHFEASLELLENLEVDLYKIFGGAGRNELTGIGVKIVEYLSARKEIVFWKELYTNVFYMFDKRDPMKDFEAVLSFLKDTNQIIEVQKALPGHTTPIRCISLPPAKSAAPSGSTPPQPPV